MAQPKVDLNPSQVQQAAAAGVQLLNTPGAVNVSGPMAVSGIVGVLNSLLTAIANQEVMVVNFPTAPAIEKIPPEGNGEKKPDLKPKPVETGKQAEK
jgi:hypothetical protein